MQVSSTHDGQIYHKLPSDQYKRRINVSKGFFIFCEIEQKLTVEWSPRTLCRLLGQRGDCGGRQGATGKCVYLCISLSLFGQSDVVYLHMHRHFKCDTSQAGLDFTLSWFA